MKILRYVVYLAAIAFMWVQADYISDLRADRQFWADTAITTADTALRVVAGDQALLCGVGTVQLRHYHKEPEH